MTKRLAAAVRAGEVDLFTPAPLEAAIAGDFSDALLFDGGSGQTPAAIEQTPLPGQPCADNLSR